MGAQTKKEKRERESWVNVQSITSSNKKRKKGKKERMMFEIVRHFHSIA